MSGGPGAPAWEVTSASVRGSSHEATQAPNQDAVRWAAVPTAGGGTSWLAAVADGHGGARYVRSDRGSRFAVGAAVEHLAAVLSREPATDPEALLRREVPDVVDRWRHLVDRDHAEQPFTAAETAAAGARLDAAPRIAYGATLLVGLITETGIGVAQIGDGDSLVRAHGFATRPVPGDARLVAGETTSLCLETAADDFRFAFVPESAAPDVVVLATDGYGNSFADPDWWHGVVDDMAGFLGEQGFGEFTARFPSWLAESARVGGDDVTAAVLVRDPLLVAPRARSAEPEPAAQPIATAPVPVPAAPARPAPGPADPVPPVAGRPPRPRPAPAPEAATLLLNPEPTRRPVTEPEWTLIAGPPASSPHPGPPIAAGPPDRRPRIWLIAGVVLVLLAAAIVVAVLLTSGTSSPPAAPSSPGPASTHPRSGGSATTKPVTTAPRSSVTKSPTSKAPPPSKRRPGS